MCNLSKRDIALAVFESMNNRDFSKFDELVNSNIQFDFPGTELIQGNKKLILFFKILFRKYKSLTFNVNDFLVTFDFTLMAMVSRAVYST